MPDRTVVCLAGDGDFLMNGQEFATAVQYDLPLVVILLDNGMYGTIRMHQEREYPGRISATMLKNPDFAAYARAFGGHGERVERTEEFAPALERAMKSGQARDPALPRRPRGDHADDDADAAAGEGVGGGAIDTHVIPDAAQRRSGIVRHRRFLTHVIPAGAKRRAGIVLHRRLHD